MPEYDVIVVGAGHAGVEACLATAKLGHKTAVVTLNKNSIAAMPCNPAIGGPAKGHVVREIDALGGVMGRVADETALQIKLLNHSRGPAVWSLRAQSDKLAYSQKMQTLLEAQTNLTIIEDMVEEIIIEQHQACGVKLATAGFVKAKIVIITTGTYMSSVILQGEISKAEGPDGNRTTNKLSQQLQALGFELLRLKTGTPARILRSSIDFSQAQREIGTALPVAFSEKTTQLLPLAEQWPCYLIYTNEKTHQIIQDNLHLSPLLNVARAQKTTGPRYCPSIEDKIVRFHDKNRHQIFLEPESAALDSIYVQGFSTTLPIAVQDKMLRTLPGLENCEVLKWAYAIEYDAILATQLQPSLETKKIANLFFAGQINGTSGYEEAACQGLMAGINAHQKLRQQQPLILKRNEAYIGVLIDDLVTKTIDEPYRLLTSRAEFRLLLRNDNARTRLAHYSHAIGLLSQEEYDKFLQAQTMQKNLLTTMQAIKIEQDSPVDAFLAAQGWTRIPENKISLAKLIQRPEIKLSAIYHLIPEITTDYLQLSYYQQLELEITIKFAGYLKQQEQTALQMEKLEKKQIPADINYDLVSSLALEAREKLKKIRPITIGHATRIAGINPADVQMLLVYLKKTYPYLAQEQG